MAFAKVVDRRDEQLSLLSQTSGTPFAPRNDRIRRANDSTDPIHEASAGRLPQ
jgi:hypothetical protein